MADDFADFAFQDCWTPVALGSRLKKRPLAIQLAGNRLVLFRSGRGRPTALLDRCPHRGAALSLGRVDKDGCLRCRFHGWRFDRTGLCVEVPLAEAKHPMSGATSFPMVERGGLLWVYTRAGVIPSDEPCVPAVLEQPNFYTWRAAQRWKAHWSRVMENLLDAPHLPFVHARTIGIGVRRRMKPGSAMELATRKLETGFELRWAVDGREGAAYLIWTAPNCMSLRESVPGRPMYLNVWCVPVSERETDVIVTSSGEVGRFWGGRLFNQLNRVILREDQRVVESQEPAEVPPPSEEKSTALDRPTLAFRRWYFERRRAARELELPSPAEVHALH